MKKSSLVFALFFFAMSSNGQLRWPAVSKTTRPWTRWWWEGSAVNKTGLTWNLEQYQKAGLGGVEITPIYGVNGHENEFIEFLSPAWMQMLVHTLNETKRLGMGADLANATGWPFGGPWVSDADASKAMYYKTYSMEGGGRLNEKVQYSRPAFVRTANNKPAAIDSILNPVNQNKNLQALAIDQIQFGGNLPLQALMAYGDHQQILNLTSLVRSDGQLEWTAPAGKWTLYALFEGLHGKFVERAAPGGEGYAIDHFSDSAAHHYFSRFDKAFKGYDLGALRGFFNDSYEVDDARGQANWTTGFFEGFSKRKGYDLRDHLPALLGKDDAETNARVIYDYRTVIDELILEHFTRVWKAWGASKGKIVRNQSHGSPANTLDLYSVVDIPETEGADILRFKFASSAAHVTGKPLVSSESATWLNEHFLSSLGDVKKAIDLYFLGGVNHIFYHGTAYSPKDAPWPGWLFYAAVHFQPANPQWKDFHVLNSYITRVQSFLQQGKPDNDVLLYYPLADRYSEPGNALLQHFDGMERNFEHTEFENISKQMLEKGYSFDFFSDRQLQQFRVVNGKIISGGNSYRTLLLPANKLLDEKSLAKILDLASSGATVLFYKDLPQNVPGLHDLNRRSTEFNALIKSMAFMKEGLLLKSRRGKGTVYTGYDLEALLAFGKARKDHFSEKGFSSVRRRVDGNAVNFVNNRTEHPLDEWVAMDEPSATVAVFDPMTGISGIANTRKNQAGQTEIQIQLQPYESILVKQYPGSVAAPKFPCRMPSGQKNLLQGNWEIQFLKGGPILPPALRTDNLVSWTKAGTAAHQDFSGTAKYTLSFLRPAGKAASWLLDLGEVHETAEVFINGKRMAALIGPVFQCVIPDGILKAANTIEIVVANLMANRIAYMDKNNLPWKIFYNTNMPAKKKENSVNGIFTAAGWAPQPSGLLGPVSLTALK